MYPNYPYFAVAITRTCGSGGGSYIGKKLAQDFDIDLYDRKLLRLAAEDSGINEKILPPPMRISKKTLLYRVSQHVYDGSFIPPESGNFISDQNLSTTRPRFCGIAGRGKLCSRRPRGGLCAER